MRTATCLLLFALCVSTAQAAARPRIVSINPCVDAVLVQVADPQQILGISHYSQDPRATSMPIEVARHFHATSGTAEEVVALAPDLVMSGPHVSPATIFALERLRIPIMKFTVAASVAQSEQEIRNIALAVGEPARGEKVIASIERALAEARPPDSKTVPTLMWMSGGMVPGTGTLADELLQRTGFRNMSAAYGLQQWDVLPLEYLLASPPAMVLSLAPDDAVGDRMLLHPAVMKLKERVPFRAYPFRLLQCGGPTIIQAVARLSAVRRELEPR